MRRLYTLLLALVAAVSMSAQRQDYALFVYRNDGGFNAFLREEIDSITLSCYDLDSLIHNEVVCQVFHTPDSIYRIPIEAIDSVSLVVPPTIVKPDVTMLDNDIFRCLQSADGGHLLFSSDVETFHTFKPGDKLVTTDMTNILPTGFFGIVVDIIKHDGIVEVVCEDLDFVDAFDSYCYIIDAVGYDLSESKQARAEGVYSKIFNIEPSKKTWDLGLNYDRIDGSSIGLNGTVGSYTKPTLRVKGVDFVDSERGRITDITIVGDISETLDIDIAVNINKREEFPFFKILGTQPEFPIHAIAPGWSVFFDAGLFFEGAATIACEYTSTTAYRVTYNYTRVGNEAYKSEPIFSGMPTQRDFKLAVNGRVAGGLFVEIGLKPMALDKNLLCKASVSADLGIEFETEKGFDFADLKQASSSTALYDAVKLSDEAVMPNLSVGAYASAQVNVRVNPFEFNWVFWKKSLGKIYKGQIFPHFSDTDYTKISTPGKINASCDISGNCPYNYRVGFSVLDDEDNVVKTEYFPQEYKSRITPNFTEYDVDIRWLYRGKHYTIYPCIDVFGYDVLASPSVEIPIEPQVDITDFTVTDSQHNEYGYYYNGNYYSYRFNVSATFEIENLEGVEDWGYVYKDPQGKNALISLKNKGTKYTDTRYVYYRNNPKSTCVLFGYVKYEGDKKYYFDEPIEFDLEYEEKPLCPDENHPHMIDLGLPSGTLWSCCNVGASCPEEYGGYYLCYNAEPFVGPNESQVYELVGSSVNREDIILKGVKGRKFTGPNGNSVFIPFAGHISEGVYYEVGHIACMLLGSRGYWMMVSSGFNHFNECEMGPSFGGVNIRLVSNGQSAASPMKQPSKQQNTETPIKMKDLWIKCRTE